MKCATSASATITRASAIMPVMTSLLPCLLSRSVEEARPADFKPCLRSITAALERAVSPTAQAPPRPAFGLRARVRRAAIFFYSAVRIVKLADQLESSARRMGPNGLDVTWQRQLHSSRCRRDNGHGQRRGCRNRSGAGQDLAAVWILGHARALPSHCGQINKEKRGESERSGRPLSLAVCG